MMRLSGAVVGDMNRQDAKGAKRCLAVGAICNRDSFGDGGF